MLCPVDTLAKYYFFSYWVILHVVHQLPQMQRSEPCDRNFLSPEIDRTLLTEVFRIFAPEVT